MTAIAMEMDKRNKHVNETGDIPKQRKKHIQHKIRIGTWNVRGTFEEGALKHLINETRKYNLDVVAIQETKQKGKITTEIEDHMFFNSGVENRMLGVGFLVNNIYKDSVIEFEGISDRLCKIRIRGKYRKLTLINAHAHSEDKDEDIKTRFYEELDEVLNKIPKFDIKCLIGDMNAKVGREEEYSVTTGGKSLHKVSNDNGKRLIEFALENSMKIVSTAFDHKDIHKETWIAPNGLTKNQIDHVLIEMKHAKNITNVRSYRGADADSDHSLVRDETCKKYNKCSKL
ncbi:hypothetical protein QE152_g3940 [Popillia japonica]|uniref:Endonuclease/exonuclease/phosphatase domain-containing protein n=1 Tax=Popillia japonica TaxID=7064 RepID=A0AAW1N1Q5_POPJA